MRKAYYYYYS